VTIFGVDVSHHQGTSLNFQGLRAAGVEFAFLKATEGAGFVDPRFHTNLRRAREAGMLVAAYHYVREGATVTTQRDHVRRVVPLDVPVVLDVEAGSGSVDHARRLVDHLRRIGYHVPLLYLPRWYWQQVGSPDLRGLPPLWSSRYPDNVVDDLVNEFARVPTSYWTGYGGLDVAVLQFTSSARVAGHAPLDANAFRGTREQLAALLNYDRENIVRDLIIARPAQDATDHWIGDGIRRRQIADVDELAGLTWWISRLGGDPEVKLISDLRVLGEVDPQAVPVQLDYARFVTDVVDQVSDRVTDQVLDALQTRGLGATVEQVAEVVRDVFRDAGTGGE
jgi:hypothetical protein